MEDRQQQTLLPGGLFPEEQQVSSGEEWDNCQSVPLYNTDCRSFSPFHRENH